MGGGVDEDEMVSLLRDFPALARLDDGRLKCSLTGHVMVAKAGVVHPYVKGKKFSVALAKEKDLDALRQFEPHIVRSKFVPGKLFCRITGRYVQAKEGAVVQHSTGKRFERGVQMLTDGQGGKLMNERPAEEVEAERKLLEGEQKAAAAANSKKAAAATAASTAAKQKTKQRTRVKATQVEATSDAKVEEDEERGEAAREKEATLEDSRAVAASERLRANGGFSKDMECWVPPAHVIDSDEDDEEEEESGEGESDEEEDDTEGEENSEDGEERSDDDEDAVPTVQMPNFAKIMAKVKSQGKKAGVVTINPRQKCLSAEPTQRRGAGQPKQKTQRPVVDNDAFDWNDAKVGAGAGKKGGAEQQQQLHIRGVEVDDSAVIDRAKGIGPRTVTATEAAVEVGSKRAAEALLKKGKKVNQSKPAKRGRGA